MWRLITVIFQCDFFEKTVFVRFVILLSLAFMTLAQPASAENLPYSVDPENGFYEVKISLKEPTQSKERIFAGFLNITLTLGDIVPTVGKHDSICFLRENVGGDFTAGY
jgi:hypothetical protein